MHSLRAKEEIAADLRPVKRRFLLKPRAAEVDLEADGQADELSRAVEGRQIEIGGEADFAAVKTGSVFFGRAELRSAGKQTAFSSGVLKIDALAEVRAGTLKPGGETSALEVHRAVEANLFERNAAAEAGVEAIHRAPHLAARKNELLLDVSASQVERARQYGVFEFDPAAFAEGFFNPFGGYLALLFRLRLRIEVDGLAAHQLALDWILLRRHGITLPPSEHTTFAAFRKLDCPSTC